MIVSKQFHLSSRNFRLIACGDLPLQSTTCLCPTKSLFIFLKLRMGWGERKKERGKKSCRPTSSEWWSPNFIRLSLMLSGGFLVLKRERKSKREKEREEKTVLGADDFSSPLHLATGSVRDWFTVKEIFFYPWFHMVWTGLHVAQHASANVFSIRCLISRELASDEACWQHNGRENLRRIHQMAALLWHLGQNLVDGELAARLLFFPLPFSTFPPSLTKCPRPHIYQINIWIFFHTLHWSSLPLVPLVCFSSVTRDSTFALQLSQWQLFPPSKVSF